MRIFIIKDVRENLAWAALLLIGLGVSLMYAVHSDARHGLALVGAATSTVTFVGFPVIGTALAMLQVLQDRRRGLWGFLTHRPISRTRIFVAKSTAGLILYLIAAGIPLTAAVFWVAAPGHIPGPFDWQMTAPAIADLISGLLWYATGLLIAAREARWIGTRLIPAGFALVIAGYAWVFPTQLWQSAMILVIGTAIIALAACAAFVADEDYEKQPVAARGVLILAVATGLAVVSGFVLDLGGTAIESMSPVRPDGPWFQFYNFAADGRTIKTTYFRRQPSVQNTMDGTPYQGPMMSVGLLALDGSVLSDRPRSPLLRSEQTLHDPDAYVHQFDGIENESWFYVVPRHTIEAFDSRDGRFVGSLTLHGFSPGNVAPVPLPVPVYSDVSAPKEMLTNRSGVYQVDLAARRIIAKSFAPAGESITGFPTTFGGTDGQPSMMAVPMTNGIRVTIGGEKSVLLPYNVPDHRYANVQVGRATDGRFFLQYRSAWGMQNRSPDCVVMMTAGGNLISRSDLPVPSTWETDAGPWYQRVVEAMSYPPIVLAALATVGERVNRFVFAVVVIVGLLSAALVFRFTRSRATEYKWKPAWIAFAAIGGIPAVLSLLAVHPMSSRVACPNCGRKRAVSQDRCGHCDAQWNPPVMQGIEVFETT